jgi:hypothetical protein
MKKHVGLYVIATRETFDITDDEKIESIKKMSKISLPWDGFESMAHVSKMFVKEILGIES